MEVAVPMIVLGSMYVLSNQDDKKKVREGYQNARSAPINHSNNIFENKKISSPAKVIEEDRVEPVMKATGRSQLLDTSTYYKNPQAPVDKLYSPGRISSGGDQQFESLTGEQITSGDLTHNNMVPFFGSKVRQDVMSQQNESRLDNMIGSGSQSIEKREIAPLFKPQENMQWAYGTPNNTDFIKTRMNPSMKMSNVKPWEEIRVAPGLGKSQNDEDLVSGSGAFNSGMEFRDIYRQKTVDELRYANNPKQTYKGVLKPGKAPVQNRGHMGTMEKHLPDTYYENNPSRYFTSVGDEKKPTIRSINLLKEQAREDTTTDYYGTNQQSTGGQSYVRGKYKTPFRPELDPDVKHATNLYVPNGGSPQENEFGYNGYKSAIVGNNRSTTQQPINESGVVAAFAKAAIAPLMDELRPSRKMNVTGNLRPLGNAGVKSERIAYNPADRARTTIREMTENRKDHLFLGGQSQYGEQNKANTYNPLPVYQNRDTTSISYAGIAGNANGTESAMLYDNMYNANMVDKEPLSRGRAPMGSNVKTLNSHINMNVRKVESDIVNQAGLVPQQLNTGTGPARQMTGQQTSMKQQSIFDNSSRNSSDLLNAFNSNPYTKSLNSVA